MDLVSGYPFWLIKNGLPFQYKHLESDLTTDVVVMGGGISGALVAYYLIKAGVGCVIIDKRAIGLGSTCASTALLQYEIDVPLSKLKKMIGLQNAVRAYKLCEEAISILGEIEKEVGADKFEFKKSLYYAAQKRSVRFLKEEFEIQK
jgi:glycine/D-amino acid oxidase-like deaminating enzyme